MTEPERILILKPSSLGDIVQALPAASALRARYPKARIVWLVKRQWAEILEGNPDLDEVLAVDLALRGWPAIMAGLRAAKFDLTIDLQGLLRTALLGLWSGARERVGFAAAREGSPWLYTRRVSLGDHPGVSWRDIPMHAVDRNLAVVAAVGADPRTARAWLPQAPVDQADVDRWLSDGGARAGDQLIGLAPADRRGVRSWPLDRFVQTASELSRDAAIRIVLIGLPAQGDVAQRFRAAIGDRVIDLMGRSRIRHLPSLMRRLSLLISNDSAPMHIATAVGTPVVALFGPTSPLRAAPRGPRDVVLRGRDASVASITVKSVVEAAQTALRVPA